MVRFPLTCLLLAALLYSSSFAPAYAQGWRAFSQSTVSFPLGPRDRSEIYNDKAPEGYQSQGEIVGRYKFLVVRLPHNRADIVVYKDGRLLYHIPDCWVYASSDYYPPGETEKAYDFFLSPDGRYLFVQRGIMNDTAVGYVYHRIGATRWAPVRPHNRQFDWAGLDYYSARRHVDPDDLGSATFVTHFVRWIWTKKVHAVVLETGAASFFELREPKRGELVAAYRVTYNFGTGRFSHIVELPM